MRTYPLLWLSSTSMSQDLASSAQKIDYTVGYSVQAVYTGSSPRGTMSLLASNDGQNFATITDSPTTISSSGTFVWNIISANYDYTQFRFASSAGSVGSLSVNFYSKGF